MGRNKITSFHKDAAWLKKAMIDSNLKKIEFATRLKRTRNTIDNWIKRGGVLYEEYKEIQQLVYPHELLENDDQAQYDKLLQERRKLEDKLQLLDIQISQIEERTGLTDDSVDKYDRVNWLA